MSTGPSDALEELSNPTGLLSHGQLPAVLAGSDPDKADECDTSNLSSPQRLSTPGTPVSMILGLRVVCTHQGLKSPSTTSCFVTFLLPGPFA